METFACEIFPSESTVFATFDLRSKVVEKKGVQVTDQSDQTFKTGIHH
jgi:hypothetical protein